MSPPLRLFVGSDVYQHNAGAEVALEASVRKNTKRDVDIVWMRQGSPGWDWGGDIRSGWATPFSMFRWFIPEYCQYEGKAIYMDADMVALRDLEELWKHPIADDKCGAYAGRLPMKADVILWQCERVPPWEREDSKGRHSHVRKLGAALLSGSVLPAYWDHRDEVTWEGPERTGILHWTRLATQPYKPYKHKFEYDIEHRSPEACKVFFDYLEMGGGLPQPLPIPSVVDGAQPAATA